MKIIFYLLSAIIFLSTQLTAQVDLKEGLQGFYTFSGNANDESGNGNHGE